MASDKSIDITTNTNNDKCIAFINNINQSTITGDSRHDILYSIRLWLAVGDITLRCNTLKLCRLLCINSGTINHLLELHIDVLIIHSLERPINENFVERMSAMKLIRQIVSTPNINVSDVIISSLISIACDLNDEFRKLALECLCESILTHTEIACKYDVVNVLLESVVDDTCGDMIEYIINSILQLVDQPSTRVLLYNTIDIGVLLSVYTDISMADTVQKEHRRASSHHALIVMLRNTSGLSLLSHKHAFQSFITILQQPSNSLMKSISWAKESVFDILFDSLQLIRSSDIEQSNHCQHNILMKQSNINILHQNIGILLSTYIDAGLLTVLIDLSTSTDPEFNNLATTLLGEILQLSQYLLSEQVSSLPNIINIASHASTTLRSDTNKIRALHTLASLRDHKYVGDTSSIPNITDMFINNQSSATNIPYPALHPSVFSQPNTIQQRHNTYQSNPYINRSTSLRRDSFGEHYASITNNNIQHNNQLHATHIKLMSVHGIPLDQLCSGTDLIDFDTSIVLTENKSNQQLLNYLKQQSDQSTDENEFQLHVKRSNVLVSKDYKQWDMAAVNTCCTYFNKSYFVSLAIKTKFIKRLLSFQRPEKNLYWSLPFNEINCNKYGRVCMKLFKLLIHCSECADYEWLGVLVEQIIVSFIVELGRDPKELKRSRIYGNDNNSNKIKSNHTQINTRDSIKSKLNGSGSLGSRAYRCMTFSDITSTMARTYINYIALLYNTQYGRTMFDKYKLHELLHTISNDLSKDYLTKRLMQCLDYTNIKAQQLLTQWMSTGSVWLRRASISHLRVLLRSSDSAQYNNWAIILLVNQLHHIDTLPAVVNTLEEACSRDDKCLQLVSHTNIKYHEIGSYGKMLQLMTLSTSSGVINAVRNNYTTQLLSDYNNTYNIKYIRQLDRTLNNTLTSDINSTIDDTFDGAVQSDQSHHWQTQSTTINNNCNLQCTSCGGYRSTIDHYYYSRLHDIPWQVNLIIESDTIRKQSIPCDTVLVNLPANTLQLNDSKKSTSTEQPMQLFVIAYPLNTNNEPIIVRVDDTTILRTHISIGATINSNNNSSATINRSTRASSYTTPAARAIPSSPSVSINNQMLKSSAHTPTAPLSPRSNQDSSTYTTETNHYADDYQYTEYACTPANRAELTTANPSIWTSLHPNMYNETMESNNCRWQFQSVVNDKTLTVPPNTLSISTNKSNFALQSIWFPIPEPTTTLPCVCLPPHLYGMLAQSKEGCQLIDSSAVLSNIIKQLDTHDTAVIRSSLLLLCIISSTSQGLALCQQYNAIQLVLKHAASDVLSIRHTALLGVRLIAQCNQGAALISSLSDWTVCRRLNIVVAWPARITTLRSSIKSAEQQDVSYYKTGCASIYTSQPYKQQRRIDAAVQYIAKLLNQVTKKSATDKLNALKLKHPSLFTSPELLLITHKLMASYRFQLSTRRYLLFDLFKDCKIDESTIAQLNSY